MVSLPKIGILSHNSIFATQMANFLSTQRINARITEDPEEACDIVITDSLDFLSDDVQCVLFIEKDSAIDVDSDDMPKAKIYKKGSFNKMSFAEFVKSSANAIVLSREESEIEKEYVKENETLRKAHEDHVSDVKNIREWQTSTYRSPSTPMPHFGHFTVYRPEHTSGISGDVLFFREISGSLFVMLADVTGHGLMAGYYGTLLYTCAECFAESAPPKDQNIAGWAQWMDHMVKLEKMKERTSFSDLLSATATLVVMDTNRGVAQALLFGSGQEPPVLFSGGSASFFPGFDRAIAPPLSSSIPTAIPKPAEAPLSPGDMVMVYSDGLTELFAGGQAFAKSYSNARILTKAESLIGQIGPKKATLSILDDAASFTGGASKKVQTANDDLTIGCFEWKKQPQTGKEG